MLNVTSSSLIRATYLEVKPKNRSEKSRKLLLIFTWHVGSFREALFTCPNFELNDVTILVLEPVHKYCTVTNRSIIVILETLTVLRLNKVFFPLHGTQQFFCCCQVPAIGSSQEQDKFDSNWGSLKLNLMWNLYNSPCCYYGYLGKANWQ
jgi:hypothetical protein